MTFSPTRRKKGVLYLELSRLSVRGLLRPADRRFATKVRYSSLVVIRAAQ